MVSVFPLAISLIAACGRADTPTPPDTDREVDADVDADTDSDTERDTDVPPDTDADTDALPDTDADTDPAEDTDPHVDTGEIIKSVTFAVIGDYGVDSFSEGEVSWLVHSYSPDFIVTTGDNNYPRGGSSTIDDNIGKYYYDYIYPYAGSYGTGPSVNGFFPSLGNHDWDDTDAAGYLGYFSLPGVGYYYEFVQGDIHFFVLDSDGREPDGIDDTSIQATWLQAALAASSSAWNVVVFHHPSYSSSNHGSTPYMQWPFAAWGVDLVLNGHDHTYEHLESDGVTYIVDGIGGGGIYSFREDGPIPESLVQFDTDHGAVIATADSARFEITAVSTTGVIIDHFWLGEPDPTLETLLPAGSTWKVLDDGSDPGPTWKDATFDDSLWSSGDAPLGFGTRDLNTTLAGATDLAARPTTTWFRTSFDVTDAAAFGELRLGLVRDDGAIVYVNGVELLRSNLPTAGVTAGTPALRRVDAGSEDIREPAWVSSAPLLSGTNTVAVEVHQNGLPIDLKFDLQIDAL
jgi:tartrate-resistant acid phosphatase type 5